MGETLGTIAGKDAYVTILAANCPKENKLFVFSMRDMTGEFQNYRDKLADHIYLNQNGYVVENDQLTDAPEPEPLSYSNDAIGYQISLPEGWEPADGYQQFLRAGDDNLQFRQLRPVLEP